MSSPIAVARTASWRSTRSSCCAARASALVASSSAYPNGEPRAAMWKQESRTVAAPSPGDPAMAKTLFILNDPPYGTERNYNALRLAASLARRAGEEVKVFLLADAAAAAKAGQKIPHGY